ncbi:MAG TPA: hypothetical protein VJ767_11280 [Nitrososphaeraceae archaeon]|nr:hypothetical protein [Nitrososphaeraceae archaeon]
MVLLRNFNDPDTFYNKPKLLALIASVVLSILTVPVILPHIYHTDMIYHIIMHLASLIISQFLALVSILAYARTKSVKILFMTMGFVTLVAVEYLYLLGSTENIYGMFIPTVNIELSHVILLIMVIFFGVSFMKGANK